MDIALVHGSYHGAWCWDLLRPELERLGHRVITVDLPISDPALGAADYAETVSKAIGPEDQAAPRRRTPWRASSSRSWRPAGPSVASSSLGPSCRRRA